MRPTCERVREIVGLINYVSICYINYSRVSQDVSLPNTYLSQLSCLSRSGSGLGLGHGGSDSCCRVRWVSDTDFGQVTL